MDSNTPQSNESQGNDLEQRVRAVIESFKPYIQADGGDIEFVGMKDDGVVQVRLHGACRGCPASQMTLKNGVERQLRERIPEVTGVEGL